MTSENHLGKYRLKSDSSLVEDDLWFEGFAENDRPVLIHAFPANPMMPPNSKVLALWGDGIPTSSCRWDIESIVQGAINKVNGLWMVGEPLKGKPLSLWLKDYAEGVSWDQAKPLLEQAVLALKASREAKAAHPRLVPIFLLDY